jgi:hypothetical protein
MRLEACTLMSPCCLSPRSAASLKAEDEKALGAVKTPSAKLGFFQRAQLATAAAWSPDLKNPPLYLDLPMKNVVVQSDILAEWAANAPLAFVGQYIGNLRQCRAIAIDVGDQDGLRIDAGKLHDVLEKYGVANSFEVYPGTHTSKDGRSFPESCDAVFQPEPLLPTELQVRSEPGFLSAYLCRTSVLGLQQIR